MRGRTPKQPDRRVNHHELVGEWRVFDPAPFTDAPGLGRRPGGGRWPAATMRWWDAVASMPHCVDWRSEDWEHTRMTALVHARVVEGDTARAGELRLREKAMGVGEEGRRALRIRYDSAAGDHQPSTASAADTSRSDRGYELVLIDGEGA